MNDDNKKPLPQDDSQYDHETHRLHSRYERSLTTGQNPNLDDFELDDFLPDTESDLFKGLGPDASGSYDSDDATLTADNPNDVVETGVPEEDADNLEGKDNIGDIVPILQEEDLALNDDLEDDDIEDFANLDSKLLVSDELTYDQIEDLEDTEE